MKANELRIGNWVYHKGANFEPIQIDKGEQIDGCEFAEPIPLTPEILEKCCIKDVWIKNSWKVVEDISGGESFGWSMKVRNANYDKEIEFAYFKYLHQLQNLYFALTGFELIYNI